MRGWRMHQKHSTSATKSGTRRKSFHGRKFSTSAARKESRIVLARTGRRMCCGLSGPIGLFLFRVLRPAPSLVGAPLLARLHVVGARRDRLEVVRQDEDVAPAIDAAGRPADDAGEAVLAVALDGDHRG